MQQQTSHIRQKLLAVINDFCGFGRCSIAVALPIISAMHIQCCPLPTAIFSDHTGFESFFCEVFTENMPVCYDMFHYMLRCLSLLVAVQLILFY